MLLQDRMQELNKEYQVQIFATDIDPDAIETARAGIYQDNIAADVAPEQLRRYFIHLHF
jgi:two-component system CheB/CheR fusion protein